MPHPGPFSFSCPTDVRFGAGALQSLTEVLPPSARSILLVKGSSNTASGPVRKLLSAAGLEVQPVVCAGEPGVRTVNDAYRSLASRSVDCIVACGGGSVIDTAKALRVALLKGADLTDDDFAVNHGPMGQIPLIVLPTTAGTGSEVTANAVLGAATSNAKVSLRGRGLQADIAIVDPDLMRNAPRRVVLFAGMDAVVQNIESFTSAKATPFTRALSQPAMATTLGALVEILETGDEGAWADLACGSLASGIALANGGLGAVHGIASVVGGAFPAPHGGVCARLLAPVIRANLASSACSPAVRDDIQECIAVICDQFAPTQGDDPLSGLESWLSDQDLPRLADWGVTLGDVEALAGASTTASSSLKNPVKLTPREFADIISQAL
ncbi:iron-containing alcohol dehydrogenase [Jannaschia sp. 2305UL9-9]|uniref:iron-containing alcohol dehydrogenase n=1 Tax=Jannaschia sp. 2305UL9-9 TaxID=3121638 RepID=UPI0035284D99